MKILNSLEAKVKLKADLVIDGKNYRDVTVREVVGWDEKHISTDAIRTNIFDMLDHTIHRCITEVKGAKRLPTLEEVRELPTIVLDDLALSIRELTLGANIKDKRVCDKCQKNFTMPVKKVKDFASKGKSYGSELVQLDRGILIQPENEGEEAILIKEILVSRQNGNTRRSMSDKKDEDLGKFGELNNEILLENIIDINGEEPTLDIISGMAKIDRVKVIDFINGGEAEVEFTKEIVCPFCGEVNKHTYNLLDFLV